MRAIMLAAGVGRRLFGDDHDRPPKALLEFGGKSLLRRHLETLTALGFDELSLVVGYRKDELLAEAHRFVSRRFVHPVHNPRYHEGSVVSLWTARDVLGAGESVVIMDADVLYDPRLMEQLVGSVHANCFLVDRDFEPGDEPVKLCIRDGRPVEFGKQVSGTFDVVGEWPGFLKLAPEMAVRLADACADVMDQHGVDVPCEDAMRKVLVESPGGTFGFEDITGLPWIEIDFPGDVSRAETRILPRLSAVWPSPAEHIAAGKVLPSA